jgi:hypothetical protein
MTEQERSVLSLRYRSRVPREAQESAELGFDPRNHWALRNRCVTDLSVLNDFGAFGVTQNQ